VPKLGSPHTFGIANDEFKLNIFYGNKGLQPFVRYEEVPF